jgi:hypothetical protein
MQLAPADHATFALLAARLRGQTDALPASLRTLARPALERMLAGEFAQLAGLLPAWLADLLPIAGEVALDLGAAGLYAWWYGQIVDDVLDGAAPPALLPVAQHALMQALAGYSRLGLLGGATWADLHGRARASAAAYADELAGRAAPLGALSDELLARWTPELAMDRAAPFGFVAAAQAQLAGLLDDDRRRADLAAALRLLTGARQLADDASDWLDDLRAGQLNTVAAGLVRHFRRQRPAEAAGLSLEQLAGYELAAEDYWAEAEQIYADLCRQALERLEPYGECRLRGLILYQQQSDSAGWARMRERRAELRALFVRELGPAARQDSP